MMAAESKKSGTAGNDVVPSPRPSPRKAIPVICGRTDDEYRRNYADAVIAPEVAAYRVVSAAEAKSGLGEQLDTPAILEALRGHAATVNRGNLEHVEVMLMSQATALQSLFARLAERGMACNDSGPFEINMRIALRAQSQCRAALETLAAIKNPQPVAFVRQANIANGPQQVNNGPSPAEPSRPRENENQQSKLSGGGNELLPDSRASALAGRIDSPMGAVGKIDRAEIPRG